VWAGANNRLLFECPNHGLNDLRFSVLGLGQSAFQEQSRCFVNEGAARLDALPDGYIYELKGRSR